MGTYRGDSVALRQLSWCWALELPLRCTATRRCCDGRDDRLLCSLAAMNGYTDLVLAATAYRLRNSLVAFTYEELCLRVLGRVGY